MLSACRAIIKSNTIIINQTRKGKENDHCNRYQHPECGNLNYDAEKIEGVCGGDEEEWETAANKLLANYGFKLGAFDEEAGDRYELVEV